MFSEESLASKKESFLLHEDSSLLARPMVTQVERDHFQSRQGSCLTGFTLTAALSRGLGSNPLLSISQEGKMWQKN